MQIYFIMRYIDRYNSIKVPYCIFCINQRFLCKRTFQHKAFFSLNEHGLQTEIFFYKECFIVFVIHDKTWDMRWKERKKERQTPEAMKKRKWVATGGISIHDTLHSGYMLSPTELPRQPSWQSPNQISYIPVWTG